MSTTQDRLKAEWGTSDAPHDYESGRHCTMGEGSCMTAEQTKAVGIVNRYTKPYTLDDDGTSKEVLLCEPCERERVARGDTVEEFSGFKKKGRAVAYALPKLREMRLAQNFTQAELAKEAGCGEQTIMNIEGENSQASSEMATKIANALGTRTRVLRREG